MKAIDLICEVMLGKHIPKEKQVDIVRQKFKKAHIDVSTVHIRFTDNWKDCKGFKDLQMEIKQGYWVYTHHTKAAFYEFAQYNTLEESLQIMKVIKTNPFSEGTRLYYLYQNELFNVEVKEMEI